MNKYIIRNQEHSSGIIISLVYDNGKRSRIIKTSVNDGARLGLENEITGYKWYYNRGGKVLPKVVKDNKKIYSISVPFLSGETRKALYGFTLNKKHIKKMLSEYKKIWRLEVGNKCSALHGDFSIGNTIFNGDKVYLIDWEHFSLGHFPVGIDVLNLLFEQLWFEKRLFGILKVTLDDISFLINDLVRNGYIGNEHNNHLEYLIEIILSNKGGWGKQLGKIPVLKYSKSEIALIDEYISKKICCGFSE